MGLKSLFRSFSLLICFLGLNTKLLMLICALVSVAVQSYSFESLIKQPMCYWFRVFMLELVNFNANHGETLRG